MSGRNVKKGRKVLVYDFWAYDIATDIAKETLENLGIPFEVETKRKLRDPSANTTIGRRYMSTLTA
jgi:hypothetical protein